MCVSVTSPFSCRAPPAGVRPAGVVPRRPLAVPGVAGGRRRPRLLRLHRQAAPPVAAAGHAPGEESGRGRAHRPARHVQARSVHSLTLLAYVSRTPSSRELCASRLKYCVEEMKLNNSTVCGKSSSIQLRNSESFLLRDAKNRFVLPYFVYTCKENPENESVCTSPSKSHS